MTLDILLQLYVALVGLIVGSYLNVVVYRVPRGMSTVTPRSRCPRCRRAILPWDNVPVLSYLWLRARCRSCGLKIHWRYPLLEALTSVCFVAALREFGPSPLRIAVACFFSAAMIALAMIDFEHFLLPDVITWPGMAIGLLVLPWLGWHSHREAFFGAALGAGILLAVAWGWYLLKGVEGMGMGDVKMLGMIGAFLGWQSVISTLFVASFIGSVVGLALMIPGRFSMKSRLPFGVFLAIGALLTLFFGPQMVDLYDQLGRFTVGWFYGPS